MRSGDGGHNEGRGAAKPGKSIPLGSNQTKPTGAGGYLKQARSVANKFVSKVQKATGNTSAQTSSTQ